MWGRDLNQLRALSAMGVTFGLVFPHGDISKCPNLVCIIYIFEPMSYVCISGS